MPWISQERLERLRASTDAANKYQEINRLILRRFPDLLGPYMRDDPFAMHPVLDKIRLASEADDIAAFKAANRGRDLVAVRVGGFTGRAGPNSGIVHPAETHTFERPDVCELLELITSLVEPSPCDFDHKGGCQAHGFAFLEGKQCPNAKALQLINPTNNQEGAN